MSHPLITTPRPPQLCSHTKADGSPCRQNSTAAPEHPPACLWHDEHRREEADTVRERGRQARRKPVVTLDDAEPALAESPDMECNLDSLAYYLTWCTRQTAGGRMEGERLRSIVAAINALRTALTARELARQVRELNREIKRLKGELAKRAPARESWS